MREWIWLASLPALIFSPWSYAAEKVALLYIDGASYQLSSGLIVTMTAISAAFIFAFVTLAYRAQKKPVVTGQEGIIGSDGVVLSIENDHVTIRVLGEIWEAHSHDLLKAGQKVKVTGIKGLVLKVLPKDKN